MEITKDEIFMIFFSLDRDGDGVLDQTEITECFMPKEQSYAKILNSRGGLYGKEKDMQKIFLDFMKEQFIKKRMKNKKRLNHLAQIFMIF